MEKEEEEEEEVEKEEEEEEEGGGGHIRQEKVFFNCKSPFLSLLFPQVS